MASTRVRLNNPALLTWARETSGYSALEIAKHLRKQEGEILAWESGVPGPTLRQLEAIAAKVKRPLSALFLPDVPHEPPPLADFRSLPKTQEGKYKPPSLIAFREARAALVEVAELLNMLRLDIEVSLPTSSIQDSPDDLASGIRALLGVTVRDQCEKCKDYYEALDMWRDAVFELGVIIMVFRMPIEDARAFSLMQGSLAAVGLNSAEYPQGRIFSIFHEVCHLCLRKPGVSGIPTRRVAAADEETAQLERYCDRFAASFLLPSDDPNVARAILTVADDASRALVEQVAKTFTVSKYVVLRRTLDLGHLSESTYWRTYQEWQAQDRQARKPAAGGDHVATRVSHVGKRVAALVFEGLDAGLISRYDASRLLGLNSTHLGRARALAVRGMTYAA